MKPLKNLRISLKEHERELEISLKEHKREIEILQVNILQQKDDSSFAMNDLRSGFTEDSRELTARTTENHEAIRNLQISLNPPTLASPTLDTLASPTLDTLASPTLDTLASPTLDTL